MSRDGDVDVVCGTTVNVWEEHVDEVGMFLVFEGLIEHMRARGWHVETDPKTLKHYPEIARYHVVGRKGDLHFASSTSGRHTKLELYQELNAEDPNGGRYDFHKFVRMPRHLRLPCVAEMAAAVGHLTRAHGYRLGKNLSRYAAADAPLAKRVLLAAGDDETQLRFTVERPLDAFNIAWNSHHFKRDASGWPTTEACGGENRNFDRHGTLLRPGDVRYFRDCYGRLMRGVVFPNVNGMWCVVYGGDRATYCAAVDLFLPEPADLGAPRVAAGRARRLLQLLAKAVATENYARVAVRGRVRPRDKPSAAAPNGPRTSP